MPLSLFVGHGSETTLQGELRVAGVTVMIEGVIKNVENMTIVDGGKNLHIYNYMIRYKLSYHRENNLFGRIWLKAVTRLCCQSMRDILHQGNVR